MAGVVKSTSLFVLVGVTKDYCKSIAMACDLWQSPVFRRCAGESIRTSNDSESLTFGLAVALLYRSERPACISNHVLVASSGVCLGKDCSKSDWAGIDAYFGTLIGISRQSLGLLQGLL